MTRLTILFLLALIALLAWQLWRKSADCTPAPEEGDLLNTSDYPNRRKRYSLEKD